MLAQSEKGSIIGLVLSLIGLIVVLTMASNMLDSNPNSTGDSDNAMIIDQAKETADDASEAGEKANGILNNLRGN